MATILSTLKDPKLFWLVVIVALWAVLIAGGVLQL
jgi:hypothetical protein